MDKRLLLCLLSFLLSPTSTDACSCARWSDEQKMCASDFVGIVHVQKLERVLNFRKSYATQVKEIWKTTDVQTPVTVIETMKDSSMCGVHLADQTDYVMAGSLTPGGKLSVNLCGSLVRQLSSLDEGQLKQIRDISDSCTNSLIVEM